MKSKSEKNINWVLSLTGAILILTLITCSNADAQLQINDHIHIGIIDPISNHGDRAALDTNNFSLNILTGVSAVETGVSIAGIANVIRYGAKGLQIAGVANLIGQNANGTMLAGFINTYGNGNGLAMAGFANIANKNSGIQLAGFVNKSNDVSSQFAGFINVAKKVRGVQIAGFINIADSSDYAIAIINLIKNGEKAISADIDETQTTMLLFRSGGKVLYGIIGLGYNLSNKKALYVFECGLGAHLLGSRAFRFNAELASSHLQNLTRDDYFKGSLRLLPALRIAPHFEIFGGPSLNYVSTRSDEGRALTAKYSAIWKYASGDRVQDLHVGYRVGVQLIF